jgi:hypothetical protein
MKFCTTLYAFQVAIELYLSVSMHARSDNFNLRGMTKILSLFLLYSCALVFITKDY